MQIEFFQRHGQQVHHIANVQVENPIIRIFDPQDGFHVVLKLYDLLGLAVGRLIL
jgi:hypothetical protein